MKSLENICGAFRSAWDMMIDVPLPGEHEEKYSYNNDFLTALMIPAVGLVPGILLAAAGLLLAKSVSGSIIWAFAAVIVSELISSGRAGKFTAEYVAKLIFKESAGAFTDTMVTFLMLFKLAAFFLMSYRGGTGFAVLFFMLIFTLEMYCVVFPEKNALTEVEEEERKWLWYIPAAVSFVWFWSYPLVTLLSIAGICGTILFFRKKVWTEGHIINADDVTLCAGCSEIVLLVCSIIFGG